MSVFTQFDTHFSDGFYSGADHDSGLIGTELSHEHGGGLYHGLPSVDGGVDIFHGGHIVDHHHNDTPCVNEPGVHQVHDHVSGAVETYHNGHLVGKAIPNSHGGMDYYDAHMYLKNHAIPNGIGGETIYDANYHMEGMTMPNGLGADDYLSFSGNADTIIGYQDPLAHAAEYHPHAFGFEGKY